jgi:hypothetical protein
VETTKKPMVGRPRKHLTKELEKAAHAQAAKAYRARQKAKKEEWRDSSKAPQSSIIDLSALPPPWRPTDHSSPVRRIR